MGNAWRTAVYWLLDKLDRLACRCFGHLDEVVKTEQHKLTCECFAGGSHGRIYYRCVRCATDYSRVELIC